MNRDEFIRKQLLKFGCFNEVNTPIWQRDYESVLKEPNIDFDGLDMKILTDWDSTFNAPSTKWLKEAKRDFIQRDDRCEALVHIENIRNGESVPPPPDVLARIEAMRKKMRAV